MTEQEKFDATMKKILSVSKQEAGWPRCDHATTIGCPIFVAAFSRVRWAIFAAAKIQTQ
jgi:hypothetical protein